MKEGRAVFPAIMAGHRSISSVERDGPMGMYVTLQTIW
jgi:hypothetical protein